ncbi:MAG: diguanylate cyclase [Burkholderiales bacterium]|nr:diguanylate cyclase [Burkholderiales bacterium]
MVEAPHHDPESREALEACARSGREGRHAQGLILAEKAQARAAPSSLEACEAGYWIALHALRLGDLERCLRQGAHTLPQLEALGARDLRVRLLCVLVLACEQSGHFPDALSHADLAVRLAEQSNDPVLKSWALNRLGSVHRDLGEDQRGHQLLQQAAELAREAGDLPAEFAALNNLGSQLNWRSLACGAQRRALEPEAALRSLNQAWSLAERTGNACSQAICQTNLAWALRETGVPAEGLQAAQHGMRLGDAHALNQVRMHSRIEAALCSLALGDADRAAAWLAEAAPLRQEADRWGTLALQRAQADVEEALGRHETALNSFRRYHELAVEEVRIRSQLHLEVQRRQHALEMAELKSRRAALEAEMQRLRAEQLRRQAHEDALTGLYNRRFVDEQLPLLQRRAVERGKPLMALLCDADHFKTVNDSYGHRVGDQVLRQIGLLLLHSTRVSDLAARWGGEEMLLLMPDTQPAVAVEVAERLRREVQGQPWNELAPGLRVTLSIGVAAVAADGDALGAADTALYRAKRSGRNRVMLDQTLEAL